MKINKIFIFDFEFAFSFIFVIFINMRNFNVIVTIELIKFRDSKIQKRSFYIFVFERFKIRITIVFFAYAFKNSFIYNNYNKNFFTLFKYIIIIQNSIL